MCSPDRPVERRSVTSVIRRRGDEPLDASVITGNIIFPPESIGTRIVLVVDAVVKSLSKRYRRGIGHDCRTESGSSATLLREAYRQLAIATDDERNGISCPSADLGAGH